MSTNTPDAVQTTASGHCACGSHGGNATQENRDLQQHSGQDGCCSGAAESVHQAHRHIHSKGGRCSGTGHAEAGPDSLNPATRAGGEEQ